MKKKPTRAKTSSTEKAIALMLKHGLTSLEVPGFKATRDPAFTPPSAPEKKLTPEQIAAAQAAFNADEEDLLYYSCGGPPKKDALNG